jgi:hypothetical protein
MSKQLGKTYPLLSASKHHTSSGYAGCKELSSIMMTGSLLSSSLGDMRYSSRANRAAAELFFLRIAFCNMDLMIAGLVNDEGDDDDPDCVSLDVNFGGILDDDVEGEILVFNSTQSSRFSEEEDPHCTPFIRTLDDHSVECDGTSPVSPVNLIEGRYLPDDVRYKQNSTFLGAFV